MKKVKFFMNIKRITKAGMVIGAGISCFVSSYFLSHDCVLSFSMSISLSIGMLISNTILDIVRKYRGNSGGNSGTDYGIKTFDE